MIIILGEMVSSLHSKYRILFLIHHNTWTSLGPKWWKSKRHRVLKQSYSLASLHPKHSSSKAYSSPGNSIHKKVQLSFVYANYLANLANTTKLTGKNTVQESIW